jgi:hypothetical protein
MKRIIAVLSAKCSNKYRSKLRAANSKVRSHFSSRPERMIIDGRLRKREAWDSMSTKTPK